MAVTQVSRHANCLKKSFKNVSRGPSLETTETTTAGSCASAVSNASPACSTECSSSGKILIFLDWDDTLFPSTEIFDCWGLELVEPSVENALTEEQGFLLKIWEKSLQRFMKAVAEFGHCAIVTNAQTMWVEDCLRRFAPELLRSLSGQTNGPTILHAKDVLRSFRSRKKIWQHDEIAIPARYVDVYRDENIEHFKFVEMTAAKYQAMKLEFTRLFGKGPVSGCNIINFGDMEYEHEAVIELGMRLGEFGEEPTFVKSFLLPEVPTLERSSA